MDTFFVQLITVILLLAGNILFGTLPLYISKVFSRICSRQQDSSQRFKIATFLLYFGGGIFISNSFLVLLPQARKYLESQDSHTHEESEEPSGHHHDSFPIPEFIIVCSFFAAYVLHELIYCIVCKFFLTARKSSDVRVKFCSCAKRHTECSRTYKEARPDHTLFGMNEKLIDSGNAVHSTAPMTSGPQDMAITTQSDLLRSSIIAQTVPNYGTLTNISEPPTGSPLPILSPPVLLAEEKRLVEQQAVTRDQNQLILSSTLTIIALILQFLFLGMALGLRTTTTTNWYCLGVACLQSFILIFSASSDFATQSMDLGYVSMNIALLSIISPIAVIVAIVKQDSVEEIPSIAKGTVAAVACGILIYTTFYEVLRKRGEESVNGLTKLLSVLLGACTMAALQYALVTL